MKWFGSWIKLDKEENIFRLFGR